MMPGAATENQFLAHKKKKMKKGRKRGAAPPACDKNGLTPFGPP
jgi:hypothetical protein